MIKLSKPVRYQINRLSEDFKSDTVIYATIQNKITDVILQLIDINLNEILENELFYYDIDEFYS